MKVKTSYEPKKKNTNKHRTSWSCRYIMHRLSDTNVKWCRKNWKKVEEMCVLHKKK